MVVCATVHPNSSSEKVLPWLYSLNHKGCPAIGDPPQEDLL